MSIDARLAELGIALPETAVAPLAVYRPAVRSGAMIYVSGQLPTRDGAVLHPGIVGDATSVEQAQEAARQCAINIMAAVRGLHGTLDGLRLVRTVGYVACGGEFDQHPAVVNGASTLLRDVFGEELGIGARIAIGVASLPLRAPVEVEAWFEVII